MLSVVGPFLSITSSYDRLSWLSTRAMLEATLMLKRFSAIGQSEVVSLVLVVIPFCCQMNLVLQFSHARTAKLGALELV